MSSFPSSINLGIPEVPRNVPDNLFSQFLEIYQALRNLQYGLEQYSGKLYAQSGNTLASPSFADSLQGMTANLLYVPSLSVFTGFSLASLVNNAGNLAAQLAVNTSIAGRARCISTATVAIGAVGVFSCGPGYIGGFSGLTPGSTYYLGATPGSITLTPPVAAGTIVQEVGFALSTSEFFLSIGIPKIN